MTRLLATICALAAMLGIAHPMNWEGHDDWMAELPAARQLKSIEGKAANPSEPSVKRRPCLDRKRLGHVQSNPYETALPLCPERDQPEQ